MSHLFTCTCGHEWRKDAASTCPACGAVVAVPNHKDAASPPARTLTLAPVEPVTLSPLPAESAAIPVAPPGYEILDELGRGGMGVVYKARQIQAGRMVALKMIVSGGHAGREELARFRTEAEAIARLRHPHIVQIYEVGEHNGLPFFSFELCAGGSLDKKLAGTPMQPREAAALVRKLASAVQAAHEARILHRDLTPANVLLAEDGTPKITDFGIAKKLDEMGGTVTGVIMGTPSYMSPEQVRGESKRLGPAADVYALGAILYECLTGRPPFKAATTLDTLQQVLALEPASLKQLNEKTPRDLETITLKCLNKETRKRYGSAAELADDLRRFLHDEPIRARRIGVLERAVKWVRRNPLGAALVMALLAGTLISTLFAIDAHYQTIEKEKEKRNADNHAKRAEEKERIATQALKEAETTLIEGLLRPLSRVPGPINLAEVEALTRLRDLPSDRVRLRFIEEGLRTPERASQLDHRADWVIQAVVGLNAERRRHVRELLMSRLRQRETSLEVKEACISLGTALGMNDPAFERLTEETIAAALVRSQTANDPGGVPLVIWIIRARLNGRLRDGSIVEVLATAMTGTTDPVTLSLLSEALQRVSGRLDGTEARAASDTILSAMSKTSNGNALMHLSKGLQMVGERLSTPDLVHLLSHPVAAGHSQRTLLDVLAHRSRRGFRNTWQFLDWARSNGVNLVPVAD